MSQRMRVRARTPHGCRRSRRGVVRGVVVLAVVAGSWGCAPRAAAPGSAPTVIGGFLPPAPPAQQAPPPAPVSPAPPRITDLTLAPPPPVPPAVLPAPDVPMVAPTSTAGVLPVARTVRLSATAYCLRGAMRTGVRTRDGMAAADPRVIPLGSVVRVTHPDGGEVGLFVVMDTGGAIKGNKLDIYMASCGDARRWGRRPVVAEVIEIGRR